MGKDRRFERNLHKRDYLCAMTAGVYADAMERYLHHEEVLQRLKEKVWTHPFRDQIPQYMREFCRGYERAQQSNMWDRVKWVFPWENTIWESWSNMPEAGREFFKRPGCVGFHVYIGKPSACYTGNQEAFDLLLEGGADNVAKAAQLMEDGDERVRRAC